ncbi:MAG: hypothetical protein ACXAD7_04775 [Candidatus Kariarchaeaceae archaeon]|jgi:hypothetical protein
MEPTQVSSINRPEIDGVPIYNIWIMLDYGICLFHTSFGGEDTEAVNHEMFSCFISAITTFAKEFANSEIQKIHLHNMILHQYRKDEIMVSLSTKEEIKNLPLLYEFLDEIIFVFDEEFKDKFSGPVVDLETFESFQNKFYEVYDKFGMVKLIETRLRVPNFGVFFSLFGNIADKIINSIILKDKIAVVGEREQAELIISTMELFSPHEKLDIIYWTEKIIQGPDILGIPPRLEENYRTMGMKILNPKTADEFDGKSSKLAKDLVEDIMQIENIASIKKIIATRINYFFSRVTTLFDFYNREEPDYIAIEILKKDIDDQLYDLILTYIKKNLYQDCILTSNETFWARIHDS